MTTLLDAARQALPGCEWTENHGLVGAMRPGPMSLERWPDGTVSSWAFGDFTRGDLDHCTAWLRAQVTARRDALDAALGEPKHLGLGAVEWAGMHRIAAARADAAEAKLKAVVASWPAHYHRQGCPWGACNCGADAANAARVEARRLCGVGNG